MEIPKMAGKTSKKAKISSKTHSKKTFFHKILTAEGWKRMLSGKSKS